MSTEKLSTVLQARQLFRPDMSRIDQPSPLTRRQRTMPPERRQDAREAVKLKDSSVLLSAMTNWWVLDQVP